MQGVGEDSGRHGVGVRVGEYILRNRVILAVSLLVFSISLIGVMLSNYSSRYLIYARPELLLLFSVFLFFCCCAFGFLKYPAEAPYLKRITQGLGLTLGVYAIWLGGDFPGLENHAFEPLFQLGLPVIALATIGCWFRPAFGLFVSFYVLVHKNAVRLSSGANELGNNDYAPLVEILSFLSVALVAIQLLHAITRLERAKKFANEQTLREVRESFGPVALLIFCAAIGAHFGNYFMSAIAKIVLDGGALSWVLENPTSSLMLGGYNLGASPLSFVPSLFGFIYPAFQSVEPFVNAITLAAQFFCFLAFYRTRYIISFCVFFDVMHIAIFVLTGALFVPWIILNGLLAAACASLKRDRLPLSAVLVGAAFTICGHLVFYNARLGWYDSQQIRYGYYVAVTEAGEEVRVPNSFFRASSYLLYARHFSYRENTADPIHMPTSAWGQIGIGVEQEGRKNVDIMRLSKSCDVPVAGVPKADFDESRAEDFIRLHHNWMHDRATETGENPNYNFYPHHHFSMAPLYAEFMSLPIEEIVGYHYVVETVCLDWNENGFQRDVMSQYKTDMISLTPAE